MFDGAARTLRRVPPRYQEGTGGHTERMRRACGDALALAGVEDVAGVEGVADGGLEGEGAGVEFAAHAVALEDADAVLAGHGAAQRDGRVEELLERRLGGLPGRLVAGLRDQARVQVPVAGVRDRGGPHPVPGRDRGDLLEHL